MKTIYLLNINSGDRFLDCRIYADNDLAAFFIALNNVSNKTTQLMIKKLVADEFETVLSITRPAKSMPRALGRQLTKMLEDSK